MLQKYTNHGDLESSASQEGMEVDWEPLAPGAPVRLYGQEARYHMDGLDYREEQEENSLTIPSPTIASFEDAPDYDSGSPGDDIAPPSDDRLAFIVDDDDIPLPALEVLSPSPPTYVDNDGDILAPVPSQGTLAISPPTYIDDDEDIPAPGQGALIASSPINISDNGDIPPLSQEGSIPSPPTYIHDDDDTPPPSQGPFTPSPPTYILGGDDVALPTPLFLAPSSPTFIPDDDDVDPPAQLWKDEDHEIATSPTAEPVAEESHPPGDVSTPLLVPRLFSGVIRNATLDNVSSSFIRKAFELIVSVLSLSCGGVSGASTSSYAIRGLENRFNFETSYAHYCNLRTALRELDQVGRDGSRAIDQIESSLGILETAERMGL
ncbi:hypothetical protein JAAARDRAFT_48149 [Jaapia argillacea MUCL 33604]|uniref:Uncharacterized protein n=1 Tax=Jaapia argillacea MUCL 33604 TaxID=933084 RepID=A0A067Q0C8_9AGAM|nr:hypothetical protein JAAARDRAFT_48149 [Jaapia argillacea MUCL 33604]